MQHPPAAPPGRVLPQALAELAQLRDAIGDAIEPAGFATLWRHAASFLLARSAAPPEESRDWVIEARIPCDCEHCARLRAFCADPTATTVRFRMREKLRAHVASMIRMRKLDIDCKTERTGSPHTLICTKTRATYERRCMQYGGPRLCGCWSRLPRVVKRPPMRRTCGFSVTSNWRTEVRSTAGRQAPTYRVLARC